MAVARKEKARKNKTKEGQGPENRSNKQPSWLAQFTYGRPRGRKKKTYKKRSQRAGGLSLPLPRASALPHSLLFESLQGMDFPAIFLIK